jgi:hypothetical protein
VNVRGNDILDIRRNQPVRDLGAIWTELECGLALGTRVPGRHFFVAGQMGAKV